jgi:hypothetical protein
VGTNSITVSFFTPFLVGDQLIILTSFPYKSGISPWVRLVHMRFAFYSVFSTVYSHFALSMQIWRPRRPVTATKIANLRRAKPIICSRKCLDLVLTDREKLIQQYSPCDWLNLGWSASGTCSSQGILACQPGTRAPPAGTHETKSFMHVYLFKICRNA